MPTKDQIIAKLPLLGFTNNELARIANKLDDASLSYFAVAPIQNNQDLKEYLLGLIEVSSPSWSELLRAFQYKLGSEVEVPFRSKLKSYLEGRRTTLTEIDNMSTENANTIYHFIACELGSQTRRSFATSSTEYFINGPVRALKGANALYYVFRNSQPFCMKVCKNSEANIESDISELLPASNFVMKFTDKIKIDEYRTGLIMPVYACTVHDLSEAIKEKSSAVKTLTLLAISMACGVLELHKLGYGHNDIKPGNFLLNSDGTARITDYGSVRQFDTMIEMFSVGISSQYCLTETKKTGVRFDLTCFASSLLQLSIGRGPRSIEELRNAATIEEIIANHLQESVMTDVITRCMTSFHNFYEVIEYLLEQCTRLNYEISSDLMSDVQRTLSR